MVNTPQADEIQTWWKGLTHHQGELGGIRSYDQICEARTLATRAMDAGRLDWWIIYAIGESFVVADQNGAHAIARWADATQTGIERIAISGDGVAHLVDLESMADNTGRIMPWTSATWSRGGRSAVPSPSPATSKANADSVNFRIRFETTTEAA